jgi:glycosyltransferase involved in cell wall biosynthesis
MIQDGVNGRMISPANARELANAIAELLANPDLARRMAAAGERTVTEKYTLERMTLKYANLLETLARSK